MKYKLLFHNIDKINDNNITTDIFDNYNKIYNHYWMNLTTYDKIWEFSSNFNDYYYINQKHGYSTKNIKINKNKYNLDKLIKNDTINILLNKDIQINNIFELLNNNLFKNLKNINILEICNLNINDIILKKYYNKNIDKSIKYNYTLHNFIKYKYINTNNIYSNNNTKIFDSYITLDIIKKNNLKYNFIIMNISNNLIDSYEEFLNYFNNQLNFLFYLYSINKLEKNGILIIEIKNIMNKFTSDIILHSKKIFKNVTIFKSKIYNNVKYFGVTVLCKGFKGITTLEFNKLLKIAEKLLDHDPTSLNYNIKNKKIRKEYNIDKKITKKSVFKFPISFINLKDTSSEYDFIRDFNNDFYMDKIIYIKKMLKYYKLYNNKKIPKNIREKQLINSYLYAKEFDLETIPFDKGTFNSDFGKLILNDMYSNHVPITFDFSNIFTDKNSINNDLNLFDELNKIKNTLEYIQESIETRDLKVWEV